MGVSLHGTLTYEGASHMSLSALSDHCHHVHMVIMRAMRTYCVCEL